MCSSDLKSFWDNPTVPLAACVGIAVLAIGGASGANSWNQFPVVLIPLAACAALYFLPSLIAFSNSHRNKLPIFLLNLFLGWTLVGWVGALIWCYLAENSPQNSINGAGAQKPQ